MPEIPQDDFYRLLVIARNRHEFSDEMVNELIAELESDDARSVARGLMGEDIGDYAEARDAFISLTQSA